MRRVGTAAWAERGGQRTISTISTTRTLSKKEGEASKTTLSVLVIRQTEAVHECVRDLLAEIGKRPGIMIGALGG